MKSLKTLTMRFLVALLIFLVSVLPRLAFGQTAVTILHTSEHHGTLQPIEYGPFKGLGGVTRRATLIEHVRKENKHVLLVDSGDLLVGTAMSSVFRGVPDIAAMNLMGYDAMAVGNHDFDFGIEHLKSLRKEARFPFLCTNLRPKDSGVCQRFVVKSVGPLRIGLIGLIGKKSHPDVFNRAALQVLEFRDPIAAAKAAAAELRKRVELLVAITHQETEEDLDLARAVPTLDVIIGGHTPGFDGLILQGQATPAQGRVELSAPGPIFVKTHQQGRTLGRLDILYHSKHLRGLRIAEARNLPIEPNLPQDERVSRLVRDYVRRLDEVSNQVLGQAEVDLEAENRQVRTQETNLGNLLADLARSYAGTEVALVNSGQIRGGIPSGPVTLKRAMEVLPFNEPLVSFRMTGRGLHEALENSVSHLPRASGRFLQVSGLSYLFDPTAPIGSRIKKVQVDGVPLDLNRRYSIVVTQFLAEGGDGYAMFLKVAGKIDHQVLLRDLLSSALRSAPLRARREMRIRSLTPVPAEEK